MAVPLVTGWVESSESQSVESKVNLMAERTEKQWVETRDLTKVGSMEKGWAEK